MSKSVILALAAAGSLLAGAAFAEGTTSKDTTKDTSKPATTAPKSTKPAAKPAQTPTAGGVSTTTSSADVVAMAPIPDTKENRAKYGKPLSQMGRQTAARGN